MKQSEALNLVMNLAAAFPHSKLTPDGIDVYVDNLVDLGIVVAREAMKRLLSSARFMPTIAEIRSTAVDVALGPKKSGEAAYAIAMSAVRHCGWCSPPRFKDPNIAKAIGVWGGWSQLCSSPDDDPGGRARFIEFYNQHAERERLDIVAGKPLPAVRTGREFSPQRPSAPPQPEPETFSMFVPAAPRARRPDAPYRRLTAEQIDAELAERSGS